MIDLNLIEFSKMSMVDSFGRVFFYNNRVYRAIPKESAQECISFMKSELFKELTNKGLIPVTGISSLQLSGYEMILEHERLLEIKQHEWSFEMFKKVSLAVLEINEICNKYNYELKDAHTYNILFRGTKPVFGDIGSICPKEGKKWNAYKEFIGVFYIPLVFWKQQEYYIVKKLTESIFYKLQTAPFQDFIDSSLITLIKDPPFSFKLKIKKLTLFKTKNQVKLILLGVNLTNRLFNKFFRKKIRLLKYELDLMPYKEMKKSIEKLSLSNKKSEWSNYHSKNYLIEKSFQPSNRFIRIKDLIAEYESEISSVMELAGNEGLFSEYLLNETKISSIILTDYDSNAIDSAFLNFNNSTFSNRVCTCVLNFIFTSDLEDTAKRYQSDLVLALAVTHHLVLSQKYSIDNILEKIKLFSKKYVIVEFMPLGLWTEGKETKVPEWYNYEWFENHFQIYFDLILTEKLEKNRILFFGMVKNNQ